MGNTKRFFVPYEPYDVKGMKMWLEEKAEEGYRLKKMKPYFAVFEEVDRQHLKYHLEPTLTDSHKPLDETKTTRQDRGWTYAGTYPEHFHVYYADGGTKDFYPEGLAIQSKYQEKLRKLRRKIFWSFPAFLLLTFPEFGAGLFSQRPLLWFLENVRIYQFLTLGFILLGGVSQVIVYGKYRRYTRDLEKKEEESPVPSSGSFRLMNLAIQGMLYLSLFTVLFMTIQASAEKSSYISGYWNESSPVIALEELETGSNPQVNGSNYVDYNDYGYEQESIFLREITFLHQTGDIGLVGTYEPSLISTCYTAKTEGIRSLLEKELVSEMEDHVLVPKLLRGKSGNVETVYLKDGRMQYLLLSHELRLLKLEYQGDASLLDWKGEIIEQFLNASPS